MNLLGVVQMLNLVLALNTLNEAQSTPFFSDFHFERASATNGVVTFRPGLDRYREQVRLLASVDDSGYLENIKFEIKRSFIDGAQSAYARQIVKCYLKQVVTAEALDDLIREIGGARFSGKRSAGYEVFLGKRIPFEAHLGGGKLLTMENEESGWLMVFTCHDVGPKIGVAVSSYKVKSKLAQ
jgi:hypothetical protein